MGKFDDRDLYSGLIRLHMLRHGAKGRFLGPVWLRNQLAMATALVQELYTHSARPGKEGLSTLN